MFGKSLILFSFIYVLMLGSWTKTVLPWPAIAMALLGWIGLIIGGNRRWVPGYGVIICAAAAIYLVARQSTSDVGLFGRADFSLLLIGLIGYQSGIFVRSTKWFRIGLTVLGAIVVIVNLGFGAYQYYFDPAWSPFGLVEIAGVALERTVETPSAGGMFNSENHFAAFLIAPGILCGTLFLRLTRWPFRILSLGGFLIIAGGIAISTSRAVMFAFITAVVLQLILHVWLSRRAFHRKWIGGALAAGVLIIAVGAGFGHILKKEYKFENNPVFGIVGSLDTRMSMWERGVHQWMGSPVLGAGARSYSYLERSYRDCGDKRWPSYRFEDLDAIYAHNEFIQLASEYGAIGLLVVLVVLGAHIYFSWYRFSIDDWVSYDLFAISGVTGLLIAAWFDFCFHIPSVLIVFGCLLGLMSDESRRSRGLWFTWYIKATAVALLVWIFFLVVKWARADVYHEAGSFYAAADRKLEAIGFYKDGIEVDPGNYDLYAQTGRIYLEYAARYELIPRISKSWLLKAEEVLNEGVAYNENDLAMSLDLAEVASRLGKIEDAEWWYDRLFLAAPCHRQVYFEYGKHLMRQGEVVRARQLYQEMLQSIPLNWKQKLEIEKFIKRPEFNEG